MKTRRFRFLSGLLHLRVRLLTELLYNCATFQLMLTDFHKFRAFSQFLQPNVSPCFRETW